MKRRFWIQMRQMFRLCVIVMKSWNNCQMSWRSGTIEMLSMCAILFHWKYCFKKKIFLVGALFAVSCLVCARACTMWSAWPSGGSRSAPPATAAAMAAAPWRLNTQSKFWNSNKPSTLWTFSVVILKQMKKYEKPCSRLCELRHPLLETWQNNFAVDRGAHLVAIVSQ